MGTVCRFLELSLFSSLFLGLCPLNSSLSSLPELPTLSPQASENSELCLGLPSLHCKLETPSRQSAGPIVGLTLFLPFQGPLHYTYLQRLKIILSYTLSSFSLTSSRSWYRILAGNYHGDLLILSLQTQAGR